MNASDLEAMLGADLSDKATRLILADALMDLDREEESTWCRDLARPIRAADLGSREEGEPPLGRRVVDFDDTRVEWLFYDGAQVRHVRGPWEASLRYRLAPQAEARFMLWYAAGESPSGRFQEGWEPSVFYVRAAFAMTEQHERYFRETVRQHALAHRQSDRRMWAIQWPDGIIEQEPQDLALVQR